MLDHPIKRFGLTDIDDLELLIEEPDFYDYCYQYYLPDMPYGTAKARDGDPSQWIFDRLERDFKDG